MITDKLLTVSDAQAVTSSAVSTDVIDLGVARDIGAGFPVKMYFNVTEAVTASGAATVEFQVIGSAAAAMSSPVVLGSSGAIGKAALVAGKTLEVEINSQLQSAGLRYVSAYYSVATGPLTAGKFSAGIVLNVQDFKVYPIGSVVL